MSISNGASAREATEVDIDPAVFQDFADLEKEFAVVELDALRRKEHSLKSLYQRRNDLSAKIPGFWPIVLMHGPQEFQSILNDTTDAETLAAVKSLNIERYQIKSGEEGEPRSLRFTFEFAENEYFEDKVVVKELEFVKPNSDDQSGGFVSRPVGLKWKKKGKKNTTGLLDLAVDLYQAEEAVRLKDGKTGADLEAVDREGLWQHEKLRERLEKVEAGDIDGEAGSWLDFLGYRGMPDIRSNKKDGGAKKDGEQTNGKGEDDGEDADMDEEDEDDGMLDVEIFPAGEEIAIALAEDLWPNIMDYFMASQQDPFGSDDDEEDDDDEDEELEDDEIPQLLDVDELRPYKKQKTG